MTRVGGSRPPAPKPKRDSSPAARRENKAGSRGSAGQTPSALVPGQLGAGKLGSAPVDQAVVAMVKEIAADDPQRRKKVFQCFLGHAIRKNLVAAQVDSEAFNTLVDNTMAQMEADAELSREIAQATDVLIALADQANLRPARK